MIKAYNDWHVDEWCGAYPGPLHPVRDPAAASTCRRRRPRCTGSRPRAATRSRSRRTPPASGCRASTPASGTRCSPRAATSARCCAATWARRRSRRRPSADAPRAGADEPLVGDGDLHARRPAVGRLLAPVPRRCASRSPRATSAGSPTSCSAPSTPSTGTTAGCATSHRRDCRRRELFRERILCCFIEDRVGVQLLDHFNVDNVCWESDYPHSDSSWPNAPEHLEALFAGLDDATRRQDHARQRDAPLPVRPVRDPAARAVHGRRAARRGGRRRHRDARRPARRRARPRDLAHAHDTGEVAHGEGPGSGVQRRRDRDPHHDHGAGAEDPARIDRRRRCAPLVPVFLTYVLSFVYLGIYWNNHHHLLRRDAAHHRRHAVGEPAPAVLAVAVPVRHRLDGREPLRSAADRGLRRRAARSPAIAYYVLTKVIIRRPGARVRRSKQRSGAT